MTVDIIAGIRLVWDVIKGTRNLKKLDPDILMNGESSKDFLNNNPYATIIYVKGDLYLGDKSKLNEKDKNELRESYNSTLEIGKSLDIIDIDFFNRVQEFKKELPDNKNINPFLKYLKHDLRTILTLSIYIKKLFDNKEIEKAQNVREDIGKQYGKEGRKLCNLYLSGYIDGMTEFLIQEYGQDIEKVREEVDNKIRKFLAESDYIFFIYQSSGEEILLSEIKRCLKQNKPYIAIHGAGQMNIKKVRKIVEEIRDNLSDSGYDMNEENKRTLSLCPLLYVYLRKR
ncbi:MAG: hypothetical protein AABX96_03365 [Nanoarchaeota archaeon]